MPDRIWFNLDEASAHHGLKPPTLRRAIREGKLPYAKPGRAYLVKLAAVNAWLESQQRQDGRLLSKGKKI